MPAGIARQMPDGRSPRRGIQSPQVGLSPCHSRQHVNGGSLGVVLPARTVGQLDLGMTRFRELVWVIEREV